MNLARLQHFQQKQLDAQANGYSVSLTPEDLDELVHEIFRLRRAIQDIEQATVDVAAEGWRSPRPLPPKK